MEEVKISSISNMSNEEGKQMEEEGEEKSHIIVSQSDEGFVTPASRTSQLISSYTTSTETSKKPVKRFKRGRLTER